MPEAPRGTVAFLFTDIEGSTRLWERDRAAMARALERHNAVLGAAIAAHEGVHFKTIGDAFQAAFSDATAAAAAAIDAQRALAAEPWPETGPLRVRMALHVGEATPSGGERPDYLAPALNRLARLLAAGHGGQILLTDVARALVAGSLPEDVVPRDLGRHRLRDLLEGEQIWQLVIPGLPDTFPALNTLERHPTNLSPQPTSLVGRDALLAELLPLVSDPATRLLTLTGPGGVGKTRLAVQLAADALDAFPDGAFFVDLADVTEPPAVVPEIAAALGVREGGGHSLDEAVVALLAPKRLLLLLDNLEQIRPGEPLGRAIADLLGAAPLLTVLATSRAPLRIRAEREWPLDPLAVPDPDHLLPPEILAENPAVSLFLERARAARPSLALTAGNAAAIAEIVHRLDGLPLAMELAAARLRALSPNELRDRLGGQLDLLFGAAGDRPDRQQTLRATMHWSHDLLAPGQQALFRRLGVFAGGFSLEAAEYVGGDGFASGGDASLRTEEDEGKADLSSSSSVLRPSGRLPLSGAPPPKAQPSPPERGDSPSVLDGVEELLAESLLRAEESAGGELRYRMLETIRAYASERLSESGERDAAHAAHVAYFTDWSEETAAGLHDRDRPARLDRFEAEHVNLRAALGWTLDAGHPEEGLTLVGRFWKFWQYRAHFTEGRAWLDRLLAATADEPTAERETAFEAAGVLAWNQGDLAAAETLLVRGLAIARERGDDGGRARSLNNLGNVRNLMGDLDGAAALFMESLELARAMGNVRHEATSLNNLALIEMDRGNLDRSHALLEESLALKERLGAQGEMAIVFGNLALIAWLRRDLPRATALLEEALAIEREIGNPVGIADALGNLAEVLSEAGQLPRAVALHRESLLLRYDIQDWLSLPYSLESIGAAAVRVGHLPPAVRLFAAGHALRETTGAPMPATDRAQYDAVIERAQSALGADAFAALWREGLRLCRDAAVEAALALCDAVSAAEGAAGEPAPVVAGATVASGSSA